LIMPLAQPSAARAMSTLGAILGFRGAFVDGFVDWKL
jgi:hypothetical protein